MKPRSKIKPLLICLFTMIVIGIAALFLINRNNTANQKALHPTLAPYEAVFGRECVVALSKPDREPQSKNSSMFCRGHGAFGIETSKVFGTMLIQRLFNWENGVFLRDKDARFALARPKDQTVPQLFTHFLAELENCTNPYTCSFIAETLSENFTAEHSNDQLTQAAAILEESRIINSPPLILSLSHKTDTHLGCLARMLFNADNPDGHSKDEFFPSPCYLEKLLELKEHGTAIIFLAKDKALVVHTLSLLNNKDYPTHVFNFTVLNPKTAPNMHPLKRSLPFGTDP